jgi:hypothetical protein
MAASPKLPAKAVTALPPEKWAPLIEAYARAKNTSGSEDLAAHDLTQHARAGRLMFAARRILPSATSACFVFASEFW